MAASPSSTSSTPGAVRSRLDADRRDLLDLSLRNPLLNYRTRTRGLEFRGESAAQVFRMLAVEGRRLTFQAAPGQSATDQADRKLQTDLPAEALQARLLTIFHAARTSLEEQGVNTLFVVPGMLRWFERDDRERKRPLRAPLLLVPAELERSSARELFRLRAGDEDPAINLSLVTKLRADFSIELPEPPDADDDAETAPETPGAADRFLDAVADVVREQDGWEVERGAVVLGFFSFGKFLMYRDLDETSWPDEARPCDHPIVRALLHEGFSSDAGQPSAVGEDEPLDGILGPADLHQVVDADSSQLAAILDVSRGRNLLIQGPPGTGKSQTITNLISEALGRGKTVLFVAEKLAALEVVKRRLDAIGLGDACLELHSHKTRKRAVLDELRRTLGLGRPRLGAIDDDLKMLATARDRLNAYVEAVNTPIGASGVTPYEAYGALLTLQERPIGEVPVAAEVPAMAAWTSYDLKRRRALVEELQGRLAELGPPRGHPFWGSRRTVLLPTETDRLRDLVRTARDATTVLRAAADRLARQLSLPAAADRRDVERLLRAARRAEKALQLTGADLASGDWTAHRGELHELLDAGAKLDELHRRHADVLLPEAWDEAGVRGDELRSVRQALNASGRHWWRHFAPSYLRARRTLAGLCRVEPPRRIEDQLDLVDALAAARRQREVVRRHEPLGARLFGARWQGERSHWDALANLTRWTWQLHHDVRARRLPKELLAFLAEDPPVAPIGPPAQALKEALAAYQDRIDALVRFLEFEIVARAGSGPGPGHGTSLIDLDFEAVDALLRTWSERPGDLFGLVGFNHLARRCRDDALGPVVDLAEGWAEAGSRLVDAFLRRWYEALLAEAFANRPALAGFDGRGHEHAIATFADLDRRVLRHNRARLALEHWQRLPRHEGGGQLAVLRREFEKKSRHMPLRTLLARAGNAVRAVKPVFLMSPLSVASYLAPGAAPFDLVVFDEASQVRPVDALGALLRGRQAVVVGDSRQLPPTSFFDRLTGGGDAEIDDDEPAPAGDVESVLGLFAAMGAPERMLRWHYRSRHESLIAVSNREFYDDRLIVFPSPDAARREAGLVLRPVPGSLYDRGGTRTNPVEAEAVARAVLDHARAQLARPADERLTLGVAAFSMAQREAIQERIERLCRDDPASEPFFAPGGPEPFFVKNLETVQGDERDVIFISIGYGRTESGDLAMGFGPLNGDGGERRLNVLITRARLRCEVFTGLTADDIDLGRTRARGVQALKTFLAYAQERPSSAGEGLRDEPHGEPQPEFERVVAKALTAAGHTVRARVGPGTPPPFDLAIVDREQPGRYRLALGCDGPSYHAARTARDRDRLRPQVLESLGWRLRRVWSTDWVRDPAGELRRVLTALETPAETVAVPEAPASAAILAPPRVPPVAANGDDAGASPAYVREDLEEDHDGGEVDTTTTTPIAPAYQVARLADDLRGQDPATVSTEQLERCIAVIVAVESPVHLDEVGRRIADALGVKRLGSRLQSALELACTRSVHGGTIRRRGDFLWHPGMQQAVARDRSHMPVSSRKLDLIAPEEVDRAVEAVVAGSFGIEPDVLPAAVGRALGFARIGEEFRERVTTMVNAALESGQLARQGSQIVSSAIAPKLRAEGE